MTNITNPKYDIIMFTISIFHGVMYAVAQLVEALCYKPESRRFDSR
jgi:hypothetical protein